MFEARFSVHDVAHLRFAYSPLWEVVASLRVLQAPARHALHLPWVGGARAAVREAGLDLAPLLALVPPLGYIADFLTPPPTTPLPDLEEELAVVAATSAAQVRHDMAWMPRPDLQAGPLATVERLLAERVALVAAPRARLRALTDLLRAYGELVVASHWPRLRALFEADIAARSRTLARGGAHALFADLHPDVRWRGERLTVAKKYPSTVDLAGRGMVLVPCAFAWPSVLVMCDPPWQPTLIYPARAVATLWETGAATSAGLAAVLGGTRAGLLAALAGPATTTELAARLGVTPGAVSQHVGALRGAGLVVSDRAGRRSVHARTPLADALVEAAGSPG